MNYDYLGEKKKHTTYPLKIYLSKENSVVIMYNRALYTDSFNVLNTTCVVSKTYFYKVIDELKKHKTSTIKDGNFSIKIDLFDKYCEVTAGDNHTTDRVKETDLRFQDWLLSIDLRRSKRVKALIPVSVESETSFEYGAIIDLSETGFKIALNNRLNNLDDIHLSIFDEEFPVGDIKCVIKHESTKEDKFLYGLEIKDIDFIAQDKLSEIFDREKKKEF